MSNERAGNRRRLLAVLLGLGLLGVMAAALLVGVVLLLVRSPSAERSALPKPAVEVNRPAPEFELRTLDGKTVRLSDLRGQPVWLNFWAVWCGPCRQEMPDVVAQGERAAANGVRLLAIDTGEGERQVREYLKTSGYTQLPAALDTDGSVAAKYGVLGLPTHVFIDSEGVVRKVNLGPMDGEAMARAAGELR
jgi:thiol-disulfide isomerase/thioredoxin